jgi:hypothetical protein
MKKIAWAFVALTLIGCKVDEREGTTLVSEVKTVYSGTLENRGARVYVDSELNLHWNAADEISVFSTTANLRYGFDGETGDREGAFSLKDDAAVGEALPTTYGVYPYQESSSIDAKGTLTLNLPAVQYYEESSFSPGSNTMVAVALDKTSDQLAFQNLCGFVVIQLFGDATVTSIQLMGNSGEKLSGIGNVTPAYGEAPVLVMSKEAGERITLDCGEGVILGQTESEATSFWFAIPPVTFSQGFTITVTDTETRTWSKRTSAERIVARNVKNALSPIKISPLSVTFDEADLVVMHANSSRDVHYTIASESDDIIIEAMASEGIETEILKTDATTGTIRILTGAVVEADSKVVVLVSNGAQAIMKTLFVGGEAAIEVENNTTVEVPDEGGTLELEFFSDASAHILIPEEAKGWISLAPETRASGRSPLSLVIQTNDGAARSAIVRVVGDGDASYIVLDYTIEQEAAGSGDGETVPPDNEIWYLTKDNAIIDYLGENIYTAYDDIGLNGKPFDVNILEHFYDGSKCIIRCDGPITKINNRCFSVNELDRSTITSIMLPNSVQELGRYCFNMADITEFRTPDHLRTVTCPFINNPRLTKFTGKHTDGHSIIIDNVLCVYAIGSADESYAIPEGVTEIGTGAFDTAKFRHVTIPNTVRKIGYLAFERSSLESVFIPESVVSIEHNAFDLCMNMKGFYGNSTFCTNDHLCFITPNAYYGGPQINAFAGHDVENYVVPDGIASIRGMSFYYGGENLKSVQLPRTIRSIGAFAFKNCPQMQYLYGSNTTSDHRGFVLDGELQVFIFGDMTEYSTTPEITAIADNLFEYNDIIESITIGDSVVRIGYDCFANCSNLRKIVLSKNLTNFPFYCFKRSYLVEEIYLRSQVPPSVDDWTCPGSFFPEKEYENLTIYVPEESLDLYLADPRWEPFRKYLKGYKYNDQSEIDYYVSTDFSADGTVTAIQEATVGAGIDLVCMGDAFSDRQIADGTYADVMQKAADAFFSEEPYKSMKDRFNVYNVNVVSTTEGYEHSGQAFSTGHGDGTRVFGNDSKVIQYAENAIGEDRLNDAVIIVIMNEDAYAGTCYMYNLQSGNYGRGLSIAYFPMNSDFDTFNGLVSHEAGGHGFAKLADEYAYERNGAISADAIANTRLDEAFGWWKNVDFTSDPSQVKWSRFIADERYASENIGCYEGGLTYWTGVWRPTDASIMRSNVGGFNAPSRQAIWYRINKLAYGDSWEGTYEDFVAFDRVSRTAEAAARRKAFRSNRVEQRPPLAPPVVIERPVSSIGD